MRYAINGVVKNLSAFIVAVGLLGASIALGSDSLSNEGGGTSGGGYQNPKVACVLRSFQLQGSVTQGCGFSPRVSNCITLGLSRMSISEERINTIIESCSVLN